MECDYCLTAVPRPGPAGPHPVPQPAGRRHPGGEVQQLLHAEDLRPPARGGGLPGQAEAGERQVSAHKAQRTRSNT